MKLFWDSNLFIYLWESGPQTEVARAFAEWIVVSRHEVVTSALSLGEILVHPILLGDESRVRAYEEAFSGIELIAFAPAVARTFAHLRARHPGLRSPDAMQLASAVHAEADVFVTNDARLATVDLKDRLRVLALPDWEGLKRR